MTITPENRESAENSESAEPHQNTRPVHPTETSDHPTEAQADSAVAESSQATPTPGTENKTEGAEAPAPLPVDYAEGTTTDEPSNYDAILLASFGGPEGHDDVIPFLRNVTTGRGIPDERLEEVATHYRANGGISRINQQNRDLKGALEGHVRAIIAAGSGAAGHVHADPDTWNALAAWAAEVSGRFMRAQLMAGASAAQLFDSWAGSLGREDYARHVLRHSAEAFTHVKDLGGTTPEGHRVTAPLIHFGTGTGEILDLLRAAGADVVGVDYRLNLAEATRRVGAETPLQGNIDPALLPADWPVLEGHVRAIIAARQLNIPIYWGNRNWNPFFTETFREMHAAGHRRILALVTSAYNGYSSCGQYREDFSLTLDETGLREEMSVVKVRQFFMDKAFIDPFKDALAAGIADVRAQLEQAGKPDAQPKIVFVTHSIPSRNAEAMGPDRVIEEYGTDVYSAEHPCTLR